MPNATRCAYALLSDTTNSPVNLPSSNITKVALQYLGLAVAQAYSGGEARARQFLSASATALRSAGSRVAGMVRSALPSYLSLQLFPMDITPPTDDSSAAL